MSLEQSHTFCNILIAVLYQYPFTSGRIRAIERCMNIASIYWAINKNLKQYIDGNKAMHMYM